MKNKKGFTLIELLAVIVILAIIALITIPIVLNILEKARKGSFQDSAYGLMKAARLSYVEGLIDGSNESVEYDFDGSTGDNLKFDGSRPSGGKIIVDTNGNVSMAIHNGTWCAIKGISDKEINIMEYDASTCIIAGNIEMPEIPIVPDELENNSKISYLSFDSNFYNAKIKNLITNEIATQSISEIILTDEQYKEGVASVYFPGITAGRIREDVSSLNFGTSDFTVEFWAYPEEQTMPYALFFGGESNKNLNFFVQDGQTAGNLSLVIGNTRIINAGKKYTTGEWVHYAIVRKDGVFTIYENGKNIGSTDAYTGSSINITDLAIGGNSSTTNTAYKGYIDEFAIYDKAIYTGEFTPVSTSKTNATNVYYNFDEVYIPTKDSITNTSFSIQGTGDIYFSEQNQKLGQGSAYFSGKTGGRITANLPNLDFGTSDFTVEFWAYPEEQTMPYALFFGSDSNKNLNFFIRDRDSSSYMSLTIGSSRILNTRKNYTAGEWIHYAVVRKDGVFTVYENGKIIGSTDAYKEILVNLTDLAIGGNSSTTNTAYKGYIDEFVIYNKAIYTSEFTL